MMTAGPRIMRGMRYCTYLRPVMIAPGGVGPAGPVPRWDDVTVRPPMKKLPKSCSSSGPPSEPAVALAILANSNGNGSDNLRAMVHVRFTIIIILLLVRLSSKPIPLQPHDDGDRRLYGFRASRQFRLAPPSSSSTRTLSSPGTRIRLNVIASADSGLVASRPILAPTPLRVDGSSFEP